MARFPLLLAFLLAAPALSSPVWPDCDAETDRKTGPYGVKFFNATWNSTIFFGLLPSAPPSASSSLNKKFPLIVFMHGSTGQYEMYEDNLKLFASHGAVIIFPFIKSPEKDKNPLTTNTNGEYLIKAIDYAKAMNADGGLFPGLVDESNVVIAGHSMGASCSIMAAHRLPAGTAKLAIAMHPGICGPFGPPPWPSTWMPKELLDVTQKVPLLFTTATNDGAFWPAPHTAEHEYGCWGKALNGSSGGKPVNDVAFVEFSAEACAEDGSRKADGFPDGGHDCPLKFASGGRPENWWVLTAIKLYAQQDGASSSNCYKLLWGDGPLSLSRSNDTAKVDLRPMN